MDLLPLSPDQGQPIEGAQSAFSRSTGHNPIEAETSGNVENSRGRPPDRKNNTADPRQRVGGVKKNGNFKRTPEYHDAAGTTTLYGVSWYDGLNLLGTVFERGHHYSAELADGTRLGRFGTRRTAADAVFAAIKARAA